MSVLQRGTLQPRPGGRYFNNLHFLHFIAPPPLHSCWVFLGANHSVEGQRQSSPPPLPGNNPSPLHRKQQIRTYSRSVLLFFLPRLQSRKTVGQEKDQQSSRRAGRPSKRVPPQHENQKGAAFAPKREIESRRKRRRRKGGEEREAGAAAEGEEGAFE